ncbi:GNAT family N-acetyltransferase [Streptomyces sp. NPDC003327]
MDIRDVATERLLLRPLTVADADRVLAGEPAPGDRWEEGYPSVGDLGAMRRFLKVSEETGDPGVFGPYAVLLRDGGRTVGGIGFHGPPAEDGFATVGYGLAPGARGNGYATEALRALVDLARRAGAAGVKGDADLDNTASHRVMLAAGMRHVSDDEAVRRFRLEFDHGDASATARAGD